MAIANRVSNQMIYSVFWHSFRYSINFGGLPGTEQLHEDYVSLPSHLHQWHQWDIAQQNQGWQTLNNKTFFNFNHNPNLNVSHPKRSAIKFTFSELNYRYFRFTYIQFVRRTTHWKRNIQKDYLTIDWMTECIKKECIFSLSLVRFNRLSGEITFIIHNSLFGWNTYW